MTVWIASLALVATLFCAVRQVGAADYPMYLDTAARHTTEAGHMRLEVHYRAKPGNVMQWDYPLEYADAKQEVIEGEPTGSGQFWYTASLEFDIKGKSYLPVYSYLSDHRPADVNVTLMWGFDYDGDTTQQLDHTVVAISPAVDLAYDDGAGATQVTIEVPEGSSPPHWESGYFVNGPKSPLKMFDYKNKIGIKKENITKNGSTIFTFTFPTNKQRINGIFQGSRWMSYWDEGVAVGDIADIFHLSVHQRKFAGPFPDRHVYASLDNPKTCTLNYDCSLFCVVFGNQVDGIEFFMEKADGTRQEVPGTRSHHIGPYSQVVSAQADTSSTDAVWTYVCKPVVKNAIWVQEATVTVTVVEFGGSG